MTLAFSLCIKGEKTKQKINNKNNKKKEKKRKSHHFLSYMCTANGYKPTLLGLYTHFKKK